MCHCCLFYKVCILLISRTTKWMGWPLYPASGLYATSTLGSFPSPISSTPLTIQDELLIPGKQSIVGTLVYRSSLYLSPCARPISSCQKLCTLAQSYRLSGQCGAMVVLFERGEEGCPCEMNGLTLPVLWVLFQLPSSRDLPKPTTPSSSSGIASEFSSEMSTSEVSSGGVYCFWWT